MKRLRIHSYAAMDARLFLQFLALIYISQIRNVIQDDNILRNLTVRGVMEDMETLVRSKIPTVTGNSTPKQTRPSVKSWTLLASVCQHRYISPGILVGQGHPSTALYFQQEIPLSRTAPQSTFRGGAAEQHESAGRNRYHNGARLNEAALRNRPDRPQNHDRDSAFR